MHDLPLLCCVLSFEIAWSKIKKARRNREVDLGKVPGFVVLIDPSLVKKITIDVSIIPKKKQFWKGFLFNVIIFAVTLKRRVKTLKGEEAK